jgi:hypothetical protein
MCLKLQLSVWPPARGIGTNINRLVKNTNRNITTNRYELFIQKVGPLHFFRYCKCFKVLDYTRHTDHRRPSDDVHWTTIYRQNSGREFLIYFAHKFSEGLDVLASPQIAGPVSCHSRNTRAGNDRRISGRTAGCEDPRIFGQG